MRDWEVRGYFVYRERAEEMEVAVSWEEKASAAIVAITIVLSSWFCSGYWSINGATPRGRWMGVAVSLRDRTIRTTSVLKI